MSNPPDDRRGDEQLIQAINRGSEAAFEVLYRRHRDWVVRLAYRFTGDREAALDVMQETFLYVLRKFPGFTLTARFTTFLYPVVKHTALAHRRAAARESTGGEPPDRIAAPPVDPPAGRREELAALMAHLPEPQREVLLLRFVDGFTLAEIAEAAEIPLGTVKSRLHHALKTLRNDPRTKNFFNH